MARKKIEKPFFTEGMTIEEIMNLGTSVLNKMNKRDLSRATRTLALAANKRINRLLEKAEVDFDPHTGDVKYRDVSGKGVDFTALYAIGNNPKTGAVNKFGVGRSKVSRDTIYKEFSRISSFLNASSSTIPGAVKIRKQKERAVFGKTREEITSGMDPVAAAAKAAEMTDIMGDVYSQFHKWKEEYESEMRYNKAQGKRVIRMIERRMKKGMSPEAARESVERYYDKKYERQKAMEAAAEQSELDSYYNAIQGNVEDNWNL